MPSATPFIRLCGRTTEHLKHLTMLGCCTLIKISASRNTRFTSRGRQWITLMATSLPCQRPCSTTKHRPVTDTYWSINGQQQLSKQDSHSHRKSQSPSSTNPSSMKTFKQLLQAGSCFEWKQSLNLALIIWAQTVQQSQTHALP